MATLISSATGVFTAVGSWSLCNAASELNSETGNTVVSSPAYTESTAFTPGASTIDAIDVKVFTRAAVPNGTITAHIYQTGVGEVAGTAVAINVSDGSILRREVD